MREFCADTKAREKRPLLSTWPRFEQKGQRKEFITFGVGKDSKELTALGSPARAWILSGEGIPVSGQQLHLSYR